MLIRATFVVALCFALALGIGGCGPGTPQVPISADSEDTPTSRVLAGSLWANRPGQSISPDGRYLLTTQYYGSSTKVLVVPLGGGEVTVLWDVADIKIGEDLIQCWPLGWLSADRCVFAISGPVVQGAHRGERGISVFEANLGGGDRDRTWKEVQELVFIPLTSGNMSSGILIQERGEVLIHAGDILWGFSLSIQTLRAVKSGPEIMPSEGLSLPAASPDSALWIYRGDDGLRMVETATGKSTLVFPTGDSFSFGPVWSPDGRFVAAYTAPRRDGTAGDLSGLSWENYEVFLSEPGFVPMAKSITVADRQGRVVRTINVDDKALVDYVWSPDSKDLLFLTSTYRTEIGMSPHDHSKQVLVPVISYDGVWAAPVAGEEVVQIADFQDIQVSLTPNVPSEEPTERRFHVYTVKAIGSGRGLLLQVWTGQGGSVWYVSEGGPPTQVAGGEARPVGVSSDDGRPAPVLISDGSKTELWLLSPGEFRRVTEFNSSFVNLVGFSDNVLVFFQGHVFEPKGILTVFRR